MAKRFNNLKAALKSLQSPTGTSDNEPPANSILKNYKDFRDGKSDVSYPREDSSKPGSLVNKQIDPFGYTLGDQPTIVSVSDRALTSIGSAILTAANQSDVTDGAKVIGFVPAKATIFKKETNQVDTEVTSQITGVKYNPVEGNSFTIPFGQKTGSITQSAVRADIISAKTGTDKVSFTSERL